MSNSSACANSSSDSVEKDVVQTLSEKIEEQSKLIEELQTKLKGTHAVVYQLLGGLFQQRGQGKTLDIHLTHLGYKLKNPETCDTNKWGTWPTTRQGDECENKISILEEKNLLLEEKILKLERKLECTHSTVHQLLGGLFNQTTQRDILRNRIGHLFDDEEEYSREFPRINTWPTTRQGDDCERRIAILEEMFRLLKKSLSGI